MKITSTSERVQHEITERESVSLAHALLTTCMMIQDVPGAQETFRLLQGLAIKFREITEDEIQTARKADLN